MDLLQIALGMGIANTIAEDEKKKRERNIIEIPSNATNGDVIKALFSKAEVHDWCAEDDYIDIYGVDYEALTVCRKWWDAPYKRETE